MYCLLILGKVSIPQKGKSSSSQMIVNLQITLLFLKSLLQLKKNEINKFLDLVENLSQMLQALLSL